jgi:hypothetical protein
VLERHPDFGSVRDAKPCATPGVDDDLSGIDVERA